MIKYLIITFIILLMSTSTVQTQQVTDGDTLRIGDKRYRIFGIDAPEKNQICSTNNYDWKCGLVATSELIKIIAGKKVRCEKKDIDRYNRIVAICFADGRDIGKEMVSSGWALSYRKYSIDYIKDEEIAKSKKYGLWSSKFIEPWHWRELK